MPSEAPEIGFAAVTPEHYVLLRVWRGRTGDVLIMQYETNANETS